MDFQEAGRALSLAPARPEVDLASPLPHCLFSPRPLVMFHGRGGEGVSVFSVLRGDTLSLEGLGYAGCLWGGWLGCDCIRVPPLGLPGLGTEFFSPCCTLPSVLSVVNHSLLINNGL